MPFSTDRADPPPPPRAGFARRRPPTPWDAPLLGAQIRDDLSPVDPGGAARRTAEFLARGTCRTPRCVPARARRGTGSEAWWVDPSVLVSGVLEALEARDVASAFRPTSTASSVRNGNACMRLILLAGAVSAALSGNVADLVFAAFAGCFATALVVMVQGDLADARRGRRTAAPPGLVVDCGELGPSTDGPSAPARIVCEGVDPDEDLNAHLFVKGMEERMDQDSCWRKENPYPDYTGIARHAVVLAPPARPC